MIVVLVIIAIIVFLSIAKPTVEVLFEGLCWLINALGYCLAVVLGVCWMYGLMFAKWSIKRLIKLTKLGIKKFKAYRASKLTSP